MNRIIRITLCMSFCILMSEFVIGSPLFHCSSLENELEIYDSDFILECPVEESNKQKYEYYLVNEISFGKDLCAYQYKRVTYHGQLFSQSMNVSEDSFVVRSLNYEFFKKETDSCSPQAAEGGVLYKNLPDFKSAVLIHELLNKDNLHHVLGPENFNFMLKLFSEHYDEFFKVKQSLVLSKVRVPGAAPLDGIEVILKGAGQYWVLEGLIKEDKITFKNVSPLHY